MWARLAWGAKHFLKMIFVEGHYEGVMSGEIEGVYRDIKDPYGDASRHCMNMFNVYIRRYMGIRILTPLTIFAVMIFLTLWFIVSSIINIVVTNSLVPDFVAFAWLVSFPFYAIARMRETRKFRAEGNHIHSWHWGDSLPIVRDNFPDNEIRIETVLWLLVGVVVWLLSYLIGGYTHWFIWFFALVKAGLEFKYIEQREEIYFKDQDQNLQKDHEVMKSKQPRNPKSYANIKDKLGDK